MSHKRSVEEQGCIDLMYSALFARMARINLGFSLKDEIPEQLRTLHTQTIAKLNDFVAQSRKATPAHVNADWMEARISTEHLWNISLVVTLMLKVGSQEHSETYEEFMGLLVDSFERVFRAQKHRKKIYFPKYRALFKLIADELNRDINGESGKVWFKDDHIFFRMSETDSPHQIR